MWDRKIFLSSTHRKGGEKLALRYRRRKKKSLIDRIGRNELSVMPVRKPMLMPSMNIQYGPQRRRWWQSLPENKSTEGKKDGLYWPVKEGESSVPWSSGCPGSQGRIQGETSGTHAYHGYYFKILTLRVKMRPAALITMLETENGSRFCPGGLSG